MRVVKKVLAVIGGVVLLLIVTLNSRGRVVNNQLVAVSTQTVAVVEEDSSESIVAFKQTATKSEEGKKIEETKEEAQENFPLFSEWYFDPIQQFLK